MGDRKEEWLVYRQSSRFFMFVALVAHRSSTPLGNEVDSVLSEPFRSRQPMGYGIRDTGYGIGEFS
ncbi:MAG: hypothetical protein ABGZ24_20295, partial [Fuerstiella sp.]